MDGYKRDRQPRILLAEEDHATRIYLHDNLTADGYRLDLAASHNQALAHLRRAAPDLILVDVNGHTLALVEAVRDAAPGFYAAPADTPVIVLTSRREEVDRLRLLDRGGDDVIIKPFSYPEVRARIAAVLRRTAARRPHAIITVGALQIDRRTRSVTLDGRSVALRTLEYQLLCTLASDPTRVFTRAELMSEIWGYPSGHSRTLDSHACRLRLKLAHPDRKLVLNVWGIGYRLMGELAA